MSFILGLLVGYCIRGKQRLLIGTLTVIAVVCFIVLPAIALSLLALDVRRERLSRPPQTTVPVVVGLDCKTAQIKLRDANLNIRVLANRHDLAQSGFLFLAPLLFSLRLCVKRLCGTLDFQRTLAVKNTPRFS